MRARFLCGPLLIGALLGAIWICEATSDNRPRRQVNKNFPGPPAEAKAYQPPIPLGAQPVPAATLQNSYQPPISLIRSNEYQSPLNAPLNPYPGNAPRNYQPQPVPGPQSYVLPNQQQHQSHSVQYIPPTNPQHSFSVFQQSPPNSQHQPATSFSVHQQPASQAGHGQQQASFAILSDNSGLPQSTAERTYSTHSKVVASAHVPQQAIHKAPASEIQPEKGSTAKEKDAAKDEYVVYYYYYYDNDTTANNNLSLNFDDIPSLEGYDNDKLAKEPEKSASARTLAANVNSLAPAEKPEKDGSQPSDNLASQPRSVGETYVRPDRAHSKPLEETLVQPLKPVSNVFRYGSNEVPRFPVLPNFIVTEVPTTAKPEVFTPDTLTFESPTTQPAQPNLKNDDADDDDLNNVLDNTPDVKASDDKSDEEEPTTTSTTTTTESPTTTEEPTTTTEKSRRRPSLGGGGRRRFNPSPASSFSPSRSRQASSRQSSTTSSSSSSTSTTTTTRAPTRRSFQANRIRPRPAIGSNRPRAGTRTSEDNDDKVPEATTVSSTTASSRSRFTSASPRRFQSSRSRSQTTSSTSTTTRAPLRSTSSSPSRPANPAANRPRPNLITRNRPPRPGFLRPKPGSEPEEPETTTAPPAPTEEETSPESTKEELPSTNDESNETEEDEETSEEETEEPTTTERSRFSALFRPRNRNALGNRPRPVIGNRPSRS